MRKGNSKIWEELDRFYSIENGCYTQKQIDEAHDQWDERYGKPPFKYQVYALLDGRRQGKYEFGPLLFNYEPFYVGCGDKRRAERSARLSRQMDKYTHKVKRMMEIERDGGIIRCQVISYFYTRYKALLVEKKLMNLIPRQYLTNSTIHLCEVPLKEEDYKNINLGKNQILTL